MAGQRAMGEGRQEHTQQSASRIICINPIPGLNEQWQKGDEKTTERTLSVT